MNRPTFFAVLAGLSLGLLVTTLYSQEPGQGPELGIFDQLAIVASEDTITTASATTTGAQPQSKGIVHEAFATPTVFTAKPGGVVPKQPPSLEELPPEQKPEGDNVQWINGYGAWDNDIQDYYWVSGIWRNIPPNMEWVPGTWNEVTGGYQFFCGFWKSTSAGELQVVPTPPEPQQETEPPAPSSDSTWVPGSWYYAETQYVWRPGQWVTFRAGWVWVPARYLLTRVGWVFLEGYWDYDLSQRGLLFCPVTLDASCYQPGFVHRPTHVVHDQALLSCLFVHASSGCYHFGNYYDSKYQKSGIVPWTSYRVNNQCEPLFNQHKCLNKHDSNWERNLSKLQFDRFKGVAPKPPENLLLQRNLINNNRSHLTNLALVGSVNKLNPKAISIRTLNSTQLQQHVQFSKQMKQTSVLRAQTENKFATLGNIRIGDRPKTFNTNIFQNNQGQGSNQPRILTGNNNGGNNGSNFPRNTGITLPQVKKDSTPRILTNPNGNNNGNPFGNNGIRIGTSGNGTGNTFNGGTGIKLNPPGGSFQFPGSSGNSSPFSGQVQRNLGGTNNGAPRIFSGGGNSGGGAPRRR